MSDFLFEAFIYSFFWQQFMNTKQALNAPTEILIILLELFFNALTAFVEVQTKLSSNGAMRTCLHVTFEFPLTLLLMFQTNVSIKNSM